MTKLTTPLWRKGPRGPKEKMNERLRNYEAELKGRREEKLKHRRKTNSSEVGSRLHDAAKEMKTSSRRNKFEEASWE
ncbi:hypothetical protein P8452_68022 [Trifolium repens]|nr:hypothetical protein P8452_68022 [Trifolium repens]